MSKERKKENEEKNILLDRLTAKIGLRRISTHKRPWNLFDVPL